MREAERHAAEALRLATLADLATLAARGELSVERYVEIYVDSDKKRRDTNPN